MKTRTSSLLILIAALSTAGLSFASSPNPAKGYRVSTVLQDGIPIVEQGTPSFTVRRLLGIPVRKLNNDTWIYYQYNASPEQMPDDSCHTLIITFADDRVTEIKLVNDHAVQVIAKQSDAKKASSLVAAIKK